MAQGYHHIHRPRNQRSRDHLWDLTRCAVEFFHQHLPFTEMNHQDELTASTEDYCFAKTGQIYAVYLPSGGTTDIELGGNSATFTVQWFNPRNPAPIVRSRRAGFQAGRPRPIGAGLQDGTIKEITGPGRAAIGYPPEDNDKDWVALIRRKQ